MEREVHNLEKLFWGSSLDYEPLKKLALRAILDRDPAVRQEAVENLNIVFGDRMRKGYVEGTSLFIELTADLGGLHKFYVCETIDYPDQIYVPFDMDSN